MKISSKLNVQMTLLLALALCLAGIFIYTIKSIRQNSASRIQLLNEYKDITKGINLQEEIQNLTWHFLYSKNLDEIQSVKSKYKMVLELFEKNRFSQQKIHLLLDDYQALFDESLALRLELGLDHNSGLEGQLRQAIHQLEAKTSNDKIAISMLMLRRHEKDFILRKTGKYIEKHRVEAKRMRALLGENTKELDSYLRHFNIYTYKLLHLHNNSQKLIDLEKKVLSLLTEIRTAYSKEIESADLNAKEKLFNIYTISIILITLTISVSFIASFLMKQHIISDLGYLKSIMHSFAQGNRVELTNQKRYDEVGQIIKLAKQAIDKHQDLQAEISNKEIKDQLISNINHEMRTPLNAISLAHQLLERSPLNEEQEEFIQNIKASSEKLQELVDDLVSFDTLSKGELVINNQDVKLAELILHLVNKYYEKAQYKNLEFYTEFSELPKFAKLDGVKYQKILSALLSNAIKYTHQGKITLNMKFKNNELITTVSDTGIGIDKELQDKIFTGFTQGDSSISKTYAGLGLGLSLVHELTKLLNGTISVDSTLAKGSAFQLKIPVEQTLGSLEKQALIAPEKESYDYSLLVVDDQKVNLILLAKALKNLGCKVDKAFNGEEAIEFLKNAKYDLVLMDLQMPIMDGITASEKALNELKVSCPIIACTANIEVETQSKCFEAGMSAFLTKPITQDKLKEILNSFADNSLAKKKLIL